jgi:hypothetical protein
MHAPLCYGGNQVGQAVGFRLVFGGYSVLMSVETLTILTEELGLPPGSAGFLLRLLLYPEDGGDIFLRTSGCL